MFAFKMLLSPWAARFLQQTCKSPIQGYIDCNTVMASEANGLFLLDDARHVLMYVTLCRCYFHMLVAPDLTSKI